MKKHEEILKEYEENNIKKYERNMKEIHMREYEEKKPQPIRSEHFSRTLRGRHVNLNGTERNNTGITEIRGGTERLMNRYEGLVMEPYGT